jgi:hypothetical protein
MNKTMHSYVSIIGDKLLGKLKNSIDKTSSKFLTILTEDSYKKLEKNIYSQYYDIEKFIKKECNFTKININHFIEQLNKISLWVKLNFDFIYNRVLYYHKILHDTIQEKYIIINDKNDNSKCSLRSLNATDDVNDFFMKFNDTYNNLTVLFAEITKNENKIKEEIKNILDILNINITEFNFTIFNNNLQNIIKFINEFKNNPYKIIKDDLNKKKDIDCSIPEFNLGYIFDIPIVSNLKIEFTIFTYLAYGYQYKLKYDLEENKFSAYLGSYIESTVTITAGLGVSIPASIIIGVSFEVGIKGIVGSGKLSLGITFDIYKSFFSYSLQFELRYNKMEFYIRMKMFLRLLFIIWEKSFYLYKVEIVREKKVYPILSYNASFLKDKNIYYLCIILLNIHFYY